MTDKELFEKTEKQFNLKNNSKVEKVFEEGNFIKVLNEVKGPKSPNLGGAAQAAGGFFNRIAAAIPGTRGHRMRSAEARKQEAQAKKAEVEARAAQQRQMSGKSLTPGLEPPKKNETPEERKKREERNARRRETYRLNKERDHELKMTLAQKAGNQTTNITADRGSNITTGNVTSTQKQNQNQNASASLDDKDKTVSQDTNNLNLKVGDVIRYKNTKGKESRGTVTNLQDPHRSGNILIKATNGKSSSLKKNKIYGKVNESFQYSFEYIVKKYR